MLAMALGCGKNNVTNNDDGISVVITPSRAVVDFGSTFHFIVDVYGTDSTDVTWLVHEVAGGDSAYGTIDQQGNYTAPDSVPTGLDSIMVTAVLVVDSTQRDNAWAVLVDPQVIYVDFLGSDTSGIGSERQPYRTITKALTRAHSGQTIMVSAGEYDVFAGERFPLRITSGISLVGASPDSTYVTGPGNLDPRQGAMIQIDGYAILIQNLHIRSSNSLGVGIWLRPGHYTQVVGNNISNQYIGIFADGSALSASIISNNVFTADSIGIVAADSCTPLLRSNSITNCRKYGVEIRGISQPNLGDDDTTGAGHNTIRDCGDASYHYLIYNGSPRTINAIGNVWQLPIPSDNDQFIFDDEESQNSSGEVILE